VVGLSSVWLRVSICSASMGGAKRHNLPTRAPKPVGGDKVDLWPL
jgi:hypothetical protein